MKNNVYCHTELFVEINNTFTKGKYYEIRPISYPFPREDFIHLKSNEGYTVSFRYPEEYDKHFYTFKQLRKNKLENLYGK